MANIWDKAISEALKNNMITEPENNGTPDQNLDGTCPTTTAGNQASQPSKVSPEYLTLKGRDTINHWGFAQLVNAGGSKNPKDAMDDLVGWTRANNQISIQVRVNKGNGNFDDPTTLELPFDCPSSDIHLVDMNADNMDDYICVAANGDIRVALNKTGSDKKLSFQEVKTETPKHDGYEATNVRVADIDGDGRGDYCVIGNDGVTKCWKNAGAGGELGKWDDMGELFKAQGTPDLGAVRYVDVNGDGRADWVVSTSPQTLAQSFRANLYLDCRW